MECWGFVQLVSGETKQRQPGGPVAHKPLPSFLHRVERQPLREAAGSNEGTLHHVMAKRIIRKPFISLCFIDSDTKSFVHLSNVFQAEDKI